MGWSRSAAEAQHVYSHTKRAAAASDAEAASRAAVQALAAGGNAADAACAAALALGVVHPFASGLGGGGFALVHVAKSGKTVALDFRETAPAGLPMGPTDAQAAVHRGGLSIGVPGEAAGLEALVRRFGALPFSRCVEPALRLAGGFRASRFLIENVRHELARNPTTGPALIAALFDLGRRAPSSLRVGDRLTRARLATTLDRLRAEGAAGFYRGDVARSLVDAVAAAGGVLSLDDLAGYAAVERTPLEARFLGRRVLLMPPPSAGGIIIAQALDIVTEVTAKNGGVLPPTDYLHLVAEATKHGFADRARYLGDPAFTAIPLQHLLDPAYHRELANRFRQGTVLPHESYGTPLPKSVAPARDAGTAHVSVVDPAGNAVALTTTVNLEFGSHVVARDSGVLLNDQLDDFTSAPGRPDVFALSGSAANYPAPGKRPLSSMSPTIVLGAHGVELVAGAAGGPRIVSATLQLLLDCMLLGRTAEQAMTTPRVHHQWEPDLLYYESALPAALVQALAKKGHRTSPRTDIGKANLILRSPTGLEAAADPRSGGTAVGF